MLYAAISPSTALQSMFGDPLHGPVADIAVRSWGFLTASVGALLIYAFRPNRRPMALTVAVVSKAFFIVLVLESGPQFLSHVAGVAVVGETVMFLLLVWLLFGLARQQPAA